MLFALQLSSTPIFPPPGLWEPFIVLFFILFWGAALLIHLACALAVATDGKRYARHFSGTLFLSPGFWTLIALFTGLLGLMAYWAVHRSTLNPAYQKTAKEGD